MKEDDDVDYDFWDWARKTDSSILSLKAHRFVTWNQRQTVDRSVIIRLWQIDKNWPKNAIYHLSVVPPGASHVLKWYSSILNQTYIDPTCRRVRYYREIYWEWDWQKRWREKKIGGEREREGGRERERELVKELRAVTNRIKTLWIELRPFTNMIFESFQLWENAGWDRKQMRRKHNLHVKTCFTIARSFCDN